jgi:hypothetical protein
VSPHQTQLFSIDVEAHLRKAASHTFGSPAHYPVELVRAAIRRGATRVDITIGKKFLRVKDNGTGLDQPDLETVTCLVDPGRSAADKEAAVETLQSREGLGLLAIFAPYPHEIVLENISAKTDAASTIHFRDNRYTTSNSCAIDRGTCITLSGKHRDDTRENRLVEIFCRSIPKPVEIRLNNRGIGGEPVLTKQMGIIDLDADSFCSGGQIGIPRYGNLCHLRLLDSGIPWHHLSLPPQKGFVFDAAVEYTGDANDIKRAFIRGLTLHAERLYRWLCRRYSTAEHYHQDRIEELIFNHCKLTGDLSLVHQFKPFKLYNSPHSLDLVRVREKASSGTLYAVSRKKENLYYNTGSGNSRAVLSLTRKQADLLINHLDIPITFLSPVRKRHYRWHRFKESLVKISKLLILALLPTPKTFLSPDQLTAAEMVFLSTLNRYISDHPEIFPLLPVRAVMAESRRPFPALLVNPNRLKTGHGEGIWRYCVIRRNHPLVRKAVKMVRTDPKNIEIIVPLLQK